MDKAIHGTMFSWGLGEYSLASNFEAKVKFIPQLSNRRLMYALVSNFQARV
jgi:hypothetical protein